MKREELYDDWKKQRSHIEVGQNFTDQVMNQVYQYEQTKPKPLFDVQWLFEFAPTRPLVKPLLVSVGAVAGILRIAFVVCMFLRT